MGLKDLKKRRKSDEERRKHLKKKAAEAKRATGKRDRYIPWMQSGGNVFMVFPHIGGAAPYRSINMHNTPLMKCGIPDPYYDESTGSVEDQPPWTNGCPHCKKVWELYKESGMPDYMKAGFQNQKSRSYLIIQVLPLSPFFDYSKGTYQWSEANDKWFRPFIDYVLNQARVRAGEDVDPIELPEGMPEDIQYAAQCGVSLLRLKNYNKAYYGHGLVEAYKTTTKMVRKYSDDPEADPFYEPETFLFAINRDPGKKEKWGQSYTTTFVVEDFTDHGWEFPEELGELFDEKYLRDIWDLNKNTGWMKDLQTRAEQLCDFSQPEMDQYFEEIGYEYYRSSEDKSDEGMSFSEQEIGDAEAAMSGRDKRRVEDIKSKLSKRGRGALGDDIEQIDEDEDIPF